MDALTANGEIYSDYHRAYIAFSLARSTDYRTENPYDMTTLDISSLVNNDAAFCELVSVWLGWQKDSRKLGFSDWVRKYFVTWGCNGFAR